MKRFIDLCLYMAFIVFASFMLTACEKDNDYSSAGKGNGSTTNGNIPDPEGTINVSMRNGDKNTATIIGNDFYIGYDNNFTNVDNDVAFVCVGKVNGLGNITGIPKKGWAKNVALEPGNGYIVHNKGYNEGYDYNTDNNFYYRLYVEDYILSTTGGIIGAKVKYQKPFIGKDVELKLDLEDNRFQTLDNELYFVAHEDPYLYFKDFNDIVAYTFKIEDDFDGNLKVKHASSTGDGPYDGLYFSTYNGRLASGKIIITTAYGKELKFNVAILR